MVNMITPTTAYLSVVLPVYNDADALTLFLPQLLNKLTTYAGQHEVILVDDGSKDNPKQVYHTYTAQLPTNVTLKFIGLSRNFGKEAALSAGIANSQGELVLLMDADGQHPLPLVDEMLAQINNGADMVAGVQQNRQKEHLLMRTFKAGFYHFIQDSNCYQIQPNAGDFRLMRRKVVEAILALPERQRFMKGLYAWVGFKTVFLPFEAADRTAGQSKFNYGKLFELAIVGITSFSYKPLHWISLIGLFISMLSFTYGVYIVFDTLFFGKDLPGWATLSAGIMFSTGIQLLSLGVIGEYIGRLYEEIKQRPLYIIDDLQQSPAHTSLATAKTTPTPP